MVTLTGDLREELPVLFLRLRESVVKRRQRTLVELRFGAERAALASPTSSLPVRPGEAHVRRRRRSRRAARRLPKACARHRAPSSTEARALLGDDGEGVVFVVGRPNVAEAAAVIERAIRIARRALPRRHVPRRRCAGPT